MRVKVSDTGLFSFDLEAINKLKLEKKHLVKIETQDKSIFLVTCNSPFTQGSALKPYCKNLLAIQSMISAIKLADTHGFKFPFYLDIHPDGSDSDSGCYYLLEYSSNQEPFAHANPRNSKSSKTAVSSLNA